MRTETLIRMSARRLSKRIVFGNFEGAVQRGRDDEKKEEWTDCVQSNVRSFGIAGDWMAMVLEAVVCVETVTEEGRGLWPREAKQEMWLECQKKREANETGKAVNNVQGKLAT